MALGRVVGAVTQYVDVARAPGAALPITATAVATLPIGMLGLSVLLTVQASGAGFSAAGLVVGVLGLGTATGMAVQGRLLDTYGQPRVLIPVASAQLAFLVLLVTGVGAGWPVWLVGVMAFGAGACEPQVGPSLRSLWPVLVPPGKRHVATALSSILFEAPIIMAPLILTVILLVAGPATAVLVAAVCFAAGALLLAGSRASREWVPQGRERSSLLGALSSPVVRTVVLVGFGQGILTAMAQVPSAAFAKESGLTDLAPLLYGALSVGSIVGTIAYGARRWTGRAWVRLVVLLGCAAVALVLCAVSSSVAFLAVGMFLVGASIGPVAACYFGLLDDLAPHGARTESFTLVTAAALSSFAVASAVAGSIIDHLGVPFAFAAGSGAMLLTMLAVVVRRNTLRSDAS